ncbi:CAP domain-containing protein [Pseudooceanicola marinus]|uniref:CAP domain-containing protein n=1 Tax=Pseudooceanicola marinus TaxID=396013 RepID=UPI001C97CD4D|nr:CAP domain-containing protein [Pseudooceanicola marinus]MBY5971709.1 CAP domain-containing protein [Ferrimonas balearica]MCA1336084.1 CAP domain-containing protein [Pseudooceanicola marinus]
MRFILLLLPAMLFLSGCVSPTTQQPTTTLAADGKPLPKLYRISGNARNRIPYEVLDSVNTLRSAAGAPPVQLNPQLTAAAATHSRDMSNQNRPWHFGSDGSSPIDRVQRVGYPGGLIGENISETYETEMETISAWMDKDDTRRVLLSKRATDMGFAWHQENNGKIWWTLIMGARNPEMAMAQ